MRITFVRNQRICPYVPVWFSSLGIAFDHTKASQFTVWRQFLFTRDFPRFYRKGLFALWCSYQDQLQTGKKTKKKYNAFPKLEVNWFFLTLTYELTRKHLNHSTLALCTHTYLAGQYLSYSNIGSPVEFFFYLVQACCMVWKSGGASYKWGPKIWGASSKGRAKIWGALPPPFQHAWSLAESNQ